RLAVGLCLSGAWPGSWYLGDAAAAPITGCPQAGRGSALIHLRQRQQVDRIAEARDAQNRPENPAFLRRINARTAVTNTNPRAIEIAAQHLDLSAVWQLIHDASRIRRQAAHIGDTNLSGDSYCPDIQAFLRQAVPEIPNLDSPNQRLTGWQTHQDKSMHHTGQKLVIFQRNQLRA